MDTLVIALLLIILALVIVIAILLRQRGTGDRDLEAQLRNLQLGLVELRAHASARQSDTHSLAARINAVQMGLSELNAYVKARQETERRTMESIRRLETVIAGTQTKGAAGENILEAVFAKLPPDWQLRDFRIGDRTVEFGLRLPNNLVLPIDSKWTATPLLELFLAAEDVGEQLRLKRQIEFAVLRKAKEVRKYLDPHLTTPFGVAVVPDAVYDLCAGIQADVFQLNVVLISYSLFVPYLLLVFQTMLKAGQSLDMQRLESYLGSVEEGLTALQGEIEGRLSRAIRMLSNSRSEMRTYLSQVRGGLRGLQVNASAHALPEETSAQENSLDAAAPRLPGM